MFDSRTKTIRQEARRNYALSNQKGYKYRINVAAVSRQFVGEVYQRMRWIDKSRKTIQMIRGKCLDVHGGSNTNNRHTIFYNCHNGLNQGWMIDQKGFSYPRQALPDGRKFQIKSRMKTNRALFWKEHIGGNQFRLRIRDNNPENNRQWFVFNRRTRTIRAFARRSHAISNQRGSKFIRGRIAVVRDFRKEIDQNISFYGGSRRNLRNNGRQCLDVYGGSNTNNRHTTFWNCHNGLNQAWYLDQRGVKYGRYPERDGVTFQVRSAMSTRRVLYRAEHIGGRQYRLRIKSNVMSKPESWTFDWRTKTLRTAQDRRMVLQGQKGQGWRKGMAATVSYYRNNYFQRMHWYGSRRTIRNNGKQCLDVHGGSNTEKRHVIWWSCHNGLNQGWSVDKKVYKMKYPQYPLRDGIKFQIKSRMSGNRALFWKNHIGGNQYRTYIQDNNPMDNRQWFTFDWRTKTVRAWARRGHALSVRQGYKFRKLSYVVIRPYKGQNDQKIMWYSTSRKNVRFYNKVCMDVHGGRNVNGRWVIVWPCHNHLNQAWSVDQTRYSYPRQPLKDGQRFQIKSKMAGFRALFWNEHIGGGQYRLRIRNDSCKNNRQWFTFDRRSRTIRAYASRSMAISNQSGKGFRIGVAAVVRSYKNEVYQRASFYGGSRRNIRNVAGKCLDVHGGRNTNNRHVIFWNCHNGANQGWNLRTHCARKPVKPRTPAKPAPRPTPVAKGPFRPKPSPPKRKPSPPRVPDDFGPKPATKPTTKRPIRHTFTYFDMKNWYKQMTKGTGIRWTGKYFPGTRPTFQYMVNYFVKVIARRPSTTRYQWMYKVVQCIIRKEPTNNRLLRVWVQKAIKGRKDRNYKIPACVRHLWKGRLTQKPTYNDLASIIRFAFYNQRITYRGLYLFTWSVLNENRPSVTEGHTDFWKKYAGVRSAYVSGLKLNTKFLMLTSSKKIVLGD